MRALVLSLSLIVASACATEITTASPDSGAPGRDATPPGDAGQPADTGLEAMADTGIAEDAGSPAGDSGMDDAGAAPAALRWGQMTLPPNVSTLRSVWARSATEVVAGASNGTFYEYDGSTWQSSAWREPGNFGITAIWGTLTSLFVASERSVHVHSNGVVNSFQIPSSSGVADLWGFSDTDLLIPVNERMGTALVRFDGSTFTEIARPTGVSELKTVWGPSPDEIYFGGSQGRIFQIESGILTEDAVDWPDDFTTNNIATFTFHRIRGFGGEVYAVGSRHLVFRRDPTGTWQRVHNPLLTNNLEDLDGAGGQIYAVGRTTSQGPAVAFTNDTWAPLDTIDPEFNLFDIHAVSADLYFAVGTVRSQNRGVALIGRR